MVKKYWTDEYWLQHFEDKEEIKLWFKKWEVKRKPIQVVKLSDLEIFRKSFIKTLDKYINELNDDSINKFKNNDIKAGNMFGASDIKLLFKEEFKKQLGD